MAKEYWSDIEKVPSSLKPSQALTSLILNSANNSIIDFGCGDGSLLESISIYNKQLLGIDINKISIEIAAKKNIPNSKFICADLADIAIESKYDIGILQATLTVIPGFEKRMSLIRKISEIVKGHLYINEFLQTPSNPSYYERYKTGYLQTGEIGSFNSFKGDEVAYQAHHFTVVELAILVETNGFEIINKNIGQVSTKSGRIIDGIELIARKKN